MGFFDDASELFDRGVSVAKGAVSSIALEQLGFMRDFTSLCSEGAQAGYHENNGGNASYLLSEEEVGSARPFFYDYASSWVSLKEPIPLLANSFVLVTRSGCYLKNVASDPAVNAGIVELDNAGASWRSVWGLKDGGRPTSELEAHLGCYQTARKASHASMRVLYHAHVASVAALSALLPPDAKTVTNALWRSLTESAIAFPAGVGALPWMVPGSLELAQATAQALSSYPACVWQLHGVFASGETPDSAFGLVQAIDKAATVYLQILQAQSTGAVDKAPFQLSTNDLRSIAAAYNLPLNEAFL